MLQPARFVGQHVANRPFAATWSTSVSSGASVSASSSVMKADAEVCMEKWFDVTGTGSRRQRYGGTLWPRRVFRTAGIAFRIAPAQAASSSSAGPKNS